ncbi:hypothetical protein Rs2_47932 [Raphanus sativus]|nr:hypothetical protein Rs2_47932 [Raphanus sativus]
MTKDIEIIRSESDDEEDLAFEISSSIIISGTANHTEKQYKVITKDIDMMSSESDDDDQASKSRLLRADQVRSNSLDRFMRRAEKVWAVSTMEKEEDESQKPIILETNQGPVDERVAVDGGAPSDHHFYNHRCCYSSCFRLCFCTDIDVEREWVILKRQLDLWEKKKEDGSKRVSFCVRTYRQRKELMRVAATVTNGGDQSHSLLFFDIKFPKRYPYQAPSFFYHTYGLPLSNLGTQKKLRPERRYNVLDVFLHIEEIVMMNTNKSYNQMVDMLKRPLMGFEDFVKGHFRKKGAFILRNMMDEMDLGNERDNKYMFLKTYIAFEDNKAYCEHLLNSDLKEVLKRFKEKESSASENYNSSSSQETSRHQNSWSKYSFL